MRQAGASVCVRINRPLESALPDMDAAIAGGANVLMLPKVMGPEQFHLRSKVTPAAGICQDRTKDDTRFLEIVDTAAALPALGVIATAAPRVVALGVGGEDLATELEAVPSGDSLYVQAMMVLIAPRAAGAGAVAFEGAMLDLPVVECARKLFARAR